MVDYPDTRVRELAGLINCAFFHRSSSLSGPTPSNIMDLDLSHNNISVIEVPFFEPIANELKILNLSRNSLSEVSPDNIGQLRRLRCVDLSHNRLRVVEPTTFMASRKLRAAYLQHNKMADLSPTIFSSQTRLRYVDVSHNEIETLPEQIFQRTVMEIFKVLSPVAVS